MAFFRRSLGVKMKKEECRDFILERVKFLTNSTQTIDGGIIDQLITFAELAGTVTFCRSVVDELVVCIQNGNVFDNLDYKGLESAAYRATGQWLHFAGFVERVAIQRTNLEREEFRDKLGNF